MSKMLFTRWQPLKKGDIVDVVAPGFATTPDVVEAARQFLLQQGLKPRLPSDLFAPDVVCSNTDKARFEHLKSALLAKDSKMVWSLRAGYGAIRLVEDLQKIKKPKQPKIFMGYSDTTTLHNYLNHFWGWPTLHGPLMDRVGRVQNPLPKAQINEVLDVLFGRKKSIEHSALIPLNDLAKRPKTIHSFCLGGNLTVTQSHLGTKFARSVSGSVLIFEDVGERGYRVDRILKQFELAGYFKGVKAIVFGEFIRCEEPGPEKISKVPAVIERFAEEIKVPVFSGLQVGHGDAQRIVPLRTPCVLRCDDQASLIIDTGVKSETHLERS
jgi:muramoyltetrapeptide carboxypeptidase